MKIIYVAMCVNIYLQDFRVSGLSAFWHSQSASRALWFLSGKE